MANEAFELDAFLGTIQGQGTFDFLDTSVTISSIPAVERNDALAITGGTGNFESVRGTGDTTILNATTGAFRIRVSS